MKCRGFLTLSVREPILNIRIDSDVHSRSPLWKSIRFIMTHNKGIQKKRKELTESKMIQIKKDPSARYGLYKKMSAS